MKRHGVKFAKGSVFLWKMWDEVLGEPCVGFDRVVSDAGAEEVIARRSCGRYIVHEDGGSCKHPYDRDIHEWMPDMRIKMVMEGLQIG